MITLLDLVHKGDLSDLYVRLESHPCTNGKAWFTYSSVYSDCPKRKSANFKIHFPDKLEFQSFYQSLDQLSFQYR